MVSLEMEFVKAFPKFLHPLYEGILGMGNGADQNTMSRWSTDQTFIAKAALQILAYTHAALNS